MTERKLGYTTYQGRSQWYINHWGLPHSVRETTMEDDAIKLGVMLFPPDESTGSRRPFWVLATNGMSERRMPCEESPHGAPEHRLELVGYSREAPEWVGDLLIEMARYPFEHRSGLAIGHTVPVTPKPDNLWSGYVLCHPRLEPEEFNPLAIDIGIEDDWVFFAQVLGLQAGELELAIEMGGPAFLERFLTGQGVADPSPLDVERVSLTEGNA